MPQNDLAVFLWYWLLANGAALTLTLYDKRAARQGHWRIPESTLFTVAALGGALVMLASMLLIRHKTRHKNSWRVFRRSWRYRFSRRGFALCFSEDPAH